MNAVVEMKPGGALAASQASGRMAVAEIIAHVATVQEVMRAVMKPDVHYGKIPGAGDKPTLLKAGAEVLCMVFRIADEYRIEDLSTADVVRYRVTCIGKHQITGVVLGEGMGEASSGEEKYKWRKAVCEEEFNETPANLRRVKHARGKGGAFYKANQVRTEPADIANTVLKMANKRAKMAMVLNVTAASDCFAQDLEDMDAALVDHLARHGDTEATTTAAATAEPTFYPQADFDANLAVWKKVIGKGQKPDDVIAKINSANPNAPLSDAQKAAIRALLPKTADAPPPPGSHADALAQLGAAKDEDALNLVMDLISDRARTEDEAKAEDAAYDKRLAQLRG